MIVRLRRVGDFVARERRGLPDTRRDHASSAMRNRYFAFLRLTPLWLGLCASLSVALPSAAQSFSAAATLTIEAEPEGRPRIVLTGQPDLTYRFESSTNLTQWEARRTVQLFGDHWEWSEPDDARSVVCYYRAITEPLVVAPSALAFYEGQSQSLAVRLAWPPTNDERIEVRQASGGTNLITSPASLLFTPANWSTPQSVTVSVATDPDFSSSSFALELISTSGSARIIRGEAVDNDVDDEFVGPFPSWFNAKADFGAVADGINDDTTALQNALDAIRPAAGKAVLFLPSGTYRITRTLNILRSAHDESQYIMILGEDPTNTWIRWDGPTNGVMLANNGWYWRIGRLSLAGEGRAKTAIAHGDIFSTYSEYSDLVFQDLGIGIEAGTPTGQGIAETTVLRCRFRRCSDTAISIQNPNSLDWFIWQSQFEDCGRAISNLHGGGHFHAYGCLLRNSANADFSIGNTGYFSIRNNTSIGSGAFFTAAPVNGCALITLQGNTTLDARDVPIQVGNLGPVLLLDNRIETRTNLAANIELSAGLASIGNVFTIERPIEAKPSATRLDDQVTGEPVPRALPIVPGAPPNRGRAIIEVPSGTNSMGIQHAIDQAAAISDRRSVVHLPAGTYLIYSTLLVPSGSDLQLIGDGGKTQLRWAGTTNGPLIRFAGPSHALMRDLAIFAQFNAVFVDAVVVDHCDQPGSRVFMDQVRPRRSIDTGMLVDRLQNADISLRSFYHDENKVGLRVAGGPNALTNGPVIGRVAVFGGGAANNELSYDVVDGGRLLVQDVWYETRSAQYPRFMVCTNAGAFTLHGANIAPLESQSAMPVVDIVDFRGQLTFLSTQFTFPNTRLSLSGEGRETDVLLLGTYGAADPVFSSPGANATLLESFRDTASGPNSSEDQGPRDADFLRRMLNMTRSEKPPVLVPLAGGITDIRFFRVLIDGARIGIHLKP